MGTKTVIRGAQIKDDSLTGDDVDEGTLILPFIRDADGDTKIQCEETSDEDAIRFDTAGSERAVILSTGKVGIGTTTPDNLLTVAGGHISSDGGVRTGTHHFSWSARTENFGAGTADLVSYISFGNNSVWGWVEVTLTDNHIGTQTTGKYTKRYQIGRNVSNAVGHQASEVPANIGSVTGQWGLGAFEVDSNDLRIPIYRLTTLQNSVTVFVEGQLHVAALDTVDNVLNSLSLSTPAVVANSATRDYYSIMSDRVGIGTTGPDRILDILDASAPQLRLTQTDGTKYVDIQANSAGDLVITGVSTLTDHSHLKFIAAGNASMLIQSEAADGDAQLGFSVDAGSSLAFSIGVDDGDNDSFKIGTTTIDAFTRFTITSAGNVGVGTTSPHSTMHAAGSFAGAYTAFSGTTFTAITAHFILDYQGTGSTDSVLTLPTPIGIAGRIYHILNNSAGGGTLKVETPAGAFLGVNLENASSDEVDLDGDNASRQMQSLSICSTGANWFITHDGRVHGG